jgi:hypothetical protein
MSWRRTDQVGTQQEAEKHDEESVSGITNSMRQINHLRLYIGCVQATAQETGLALDQSDCL